MSFALGVLLAPQFKSPNAEVEASFSAFPGMRYRLVWAVALSTLGILAIVVSTLIAGLPSGIVEVLVRNFLGGVGLVLLQRLAVPNELLWIIPVAIVLVTWIAGSEEMTSQPRPWALIIQPSTPGLNAVFIMLWLGGVLCFSLMRSSIDHSVTELGKRRR